MLQRLPKCFLEVRGVCHLLGKCGKLVHWQFRWAWGNCPVGNAAVTMPAAPTSVVPHAYQPLKDDGRRIGNLSVARL